MIDDLYRPGDDAAITPGLMLADVSRLMRKYFEQQARAKQLGLTKAQCAALFHLSRHEGINQAALAQILEIEPITLVRLLDRLEAAGLVERRRDLQDRRARVLYLTPAAQPLIGRIKQLIGEVWEQTMAGLTPADRAAFVTTLTVLKNTLTDQLAREEMSFEEAMNG
jgi:MarR family transcriptional regulator for hemolysin